MSLSDTIDTSYRLHPADLGGRARTVLVFRVTYEGVEELTPLVHFEGMARPLALDADQRIQMAHIARSMLLADWVGTALVLRPARDEGADTIRLHALEERIPAAARRATGWGLGPRFPARSALRLLLLALLIAAAFAAVTWIEQAPNLEQILNVFK